MQHDTPQPLLNTINDTVKILCSSRTTLDKLFKTGQLRAVKVGRRTMVPTESIRAFIDSLPSKAA